MDGFASLLVAVALFREDGSWNTKSHSAVDASPFDASFGPALLRSLRMVVISYPRKWASSTPGVSDAGLLSERARPNSS